MLKKCLADPTLSLPIDVLGVDEDFFYKEVYCDFRAVGEAAENKEVYPTKVLQRNHIIEGATLDAEDDMRSRYPYLFSC